MNSRQRVLAAIEHRQPDRVPVDLGATPSSGISAIAYSRLVKHLGLDIGAPKVYDVVQQLAQPDDLGMDTGPFMSPTIYRRLFKPRHKTMCDYVKSHSSMRTFLHCCGGIRPLVADLIEAGFKILNPVQTSCKGMVPEELKKEFGQAVTFWGGGCDTRQVLNHARPDEVRDHVLERLQIFSPDGGFVFNSVHNILPDVPPENIVALFDTVREFNAQA